MTAHTRFLLAHALAAAMARIPVQRRGDEVEGVAGVRTEPPQIELPVVITDYRRRNKSDRKREPRFGRRR